PSSRAASLRATKHFERIASGRARQAFAPPAQATRSATSCALHTAVVDRRGACAKPRQRLGIFGSRPAPQEMSRGGEAAERSGAKRRVASLPLTSPAERGTRGSLVEVRGLPSDQRRNHSASRVLATT